MPLELERETPPETLEERETLLLRDVTPPLLRLSILPLPDIAELARLREVDEPTRFGRLPELSPRAEMLLRLLPAAPMRPRPLRLSARPTCPRFDPPLMP